MFHHLLQRRGPRCENCESRLRIYDSHLQIALLLSHKHYVHSAYRVGSWRTCNFEREYIGVWYLYLLTYIPYHERDAMVE